MELKKRKKPKKREQTFCTDLVNKLKVNGWGFKLPDMPARQGSGMSGGRFNLPKKFDIICLSESTEGRATAVEAKMWKLKTDPTYERVIKTLRPKTEKDEGQLAHLHSVIQNGGIAYVAVKWYIERASKYWLLSLNSKTLKRCTCIDEMAFLIYS